MEATLGGVLIIGVAVAAISALIGVFYLGLSLWSALLLYSLVGTLTTLLVGWRKYRCVTHHEELLKHE
ncbi:hypothetical protein IB235_05885 [Paracoccus sp. PAR01]|uniref:Uncharacterized protein n=1 Tax=Paracoccus litorisediminis TaxID=2006130 RepID=A0A844HLW1_9RHOB|nr:hypothetical protein [Paracoccus sp. PAR01]MTH58741.1 hypothetical protein [Paracoccus litorisediminis]